MRIAFALSLALQTAPALTAHAEPQPAPAQAPPQAPSRAPLASANLKADAAILRRALESIHPGLHRYNTPEQLAANFAALDAAVGRDLSPDQAFLELSRFTATIRCGHTFLNPHNQSDAWQSAFLARADKLPFAFTWLDRRMIVTQDLVAPTRLPRGTEILAINSTPAHAILAALLPLTRADGSNDAKRISLLQLTGAEPFETFDILFPLVFPLDRPEFTLHIRTPDGTESTLAVPAVTPSQRTSATPHAEAQAERDATAPLWSLSALPDGTPYLPMPSWVAYKTKRDWAADLHQIFDTLARDAAPNLVIDLRGNEGGSSVGDVILSRLIDVPVPAAATHRYVKYLKTPADLDPFLDTWDNSFRDWSKDAIGPLDLADLPTGLPAGTTAGFYRLRNEDLTDPADAAELIHARAPRFTGRVYVLVDASNSSATFEFARAVRALRVATLVGRPTGGNQRGINGGAFFFLRLPNSGVEIDLPLMAQFAVGGPTPPDEGITPDILVTPTVDSIAQGIDVDLREVARLISSRK